MPIGEFKERTRLKLFDRFFPKKALEREDDRVRREEWILNALEFNEKHITNENVSARDLGHLKRSVKAAGMPPRLWNALKRVMDAKPGEKNEKLESLKQQLHESLGNRRAYAELLRKKVYG